MSTIAGAERFSRFAFATAAAVNQLASRWTAEACLPSNPHCSIVYESGRPIQTMVPVRDKPTAGRTLPAVAGAPRACAALPSAAKTWTIA